jgi:AcrR family transcriptional regulator
MSPARARTTDEAILDAAARLLETGGLDALTMQAVAAAVGVRAPSLYKRVRDRAALVRAVQEDGAAELGAALRDVSKGKDPRADLLAMADTFRAFAHRRSGAYGLLFAALPDDMQVAPETNQAAVAPVLTALTALQARGGKGRRGGRGGHGAKTDAKAASKAGGDPALEAARLFVAFAHGFVSMELAGAFRLGGDVDRAWRTGVATIVDAVADSRPK